MKIKRKVELIEVKKLLHIEEFGPKKVINLREKILTDNKWTNPLKISTDFLVMDGQHRMEVAKSLNLKYVPCLIYDYNEVEVWSLRKNQVVTRDLIIKKAHARDIYPYKTAKHSFPDSGSLICNFNLQELKG